MNDNESGRAVWDSLRSTTQTVVYKRDYYTCRYCYWFVDVFGAFDGRGLGIDHIIPMSGGGSPFGGNVVTCCVSCNSYKGTKSLEEAGLLVVPPILEVLGFLPDPVTYEERQSVIEQARRACLTLLREQGVDTSGLYLERIVTVPKKQKEQKTPEQKKLEHDEKWRKALRQTYLSYGMTGPEADLAAARAMDKEQFQRVIGAKDAKF